MRVFLTGATGFVGGHIVDRLLVRGDEVTALVRSPARAAGLAERGVRLVRGDLHDLPALHAGAADADVVLHVAALTGAVDEREFLAANRDGTANVLAAASAAPRTPRLVYVSSRAAGGPARRGRPKVDALDDRPVTMYGRSKLAGEQVLRASAHPWVILRPPTVYGPRDRDNLLTVFKAARTGFAPVFGAGTMELSAIHVTDLADACLAALAGEGVVRGTFYVNHPEVVTSAELVRRIGATMGRRVRLVGIPEWLARVALTATGTFAALFHRKTILRADKANEFYQEAWTGDPAPFGALTGWRAARDLTTGLAETYTFYRGAGWL
ncbi:MAG TPA: NAD-dependent epimerase/dehydratase family protein [Gemmatimonadales bacterium]|nr:NAD-dependent epimerase/dehydratase family protein [Gemmatimonadales bacterium]